MAYDTSLMGQWQPVLQMGDYSNPGTMGGGNWVGQQGVDYGQPPMPGMQPYFDNATGRFAGWTMPGGNGGGGSGLFGDFGDPSTRQQYYLDAQGNAVRADQTADPSRSGATGFMSYAMPISMIAGLGAGAAGGAFTGAGAAGGAGTGGAITGAAESMWPGLAGAAGGGTGTAGGYIGALGGAGATGGSLAGGLGGALGGFGDYGSLAGQLGSAMTGSPEVSYGPGQNPTGMGEYAGGRVPPASSSGGMSWDKILQGLGGLGGSGSSTNGGSDLGGLLGSLLGGGLGYLDARNQPDSLTIKNEIDPRLANAWYGADGTGGLTGAAGNLLQQQLGQPNPLTQAGQQISGMANTLPSYNDAVTNNQSLWNSNPWVQDQQKAITDLTTRNLLENVMPNIGSNAAMAGGYGGSRQGIAQGKAISDMNTNLAPALTGLASSAYENSQNRALQGAGTQLNYGLNNQLQQAGLLGTGANLQANGAWNPLTQYSNIMRGAPGSTSQTQPLFVNPVTSALGGANLGGQIGSSTNWGDIFKGISGGINGIGGIFDWFKKA